MAITKKAAAALETLRAMQPFLVVPARQIRRRYSRGALETIPAHIETGINTLILHNLRDAGKIVCGHIYLRGRVSPDLRVVEVEAVR